jgi:hypothetical protein
MTDLTSLLKMFSRLMKTSPFASFEGRFVAEMEADFAADRPIVVEFGPSISGDGVHFVGPFPGELGRIGKEGAIEAGDHASEPNLAEPVTLKLDVGGLDHVQVIPVPEPHLYDPPFADQCIVSAAPHVVSSSLGIRMRLMKTAWTFARPRTLTWAMPPIVLIQPKTSSIRLRQR